MEGSDSKPIDTLTGISETADGLHKQSNPNSEKIKFSSTNKQQNSYGYIKLCYRLRIKELEEENKRLQEYISMHFEMLS